MALAVAAQQRKMPMHPLPFTEVAGGLLPPCRRDQTICVWVRFEAVEGWSVTRKVHVATCTTPREVVHQQVQALNAMFSLSLDPEKHVLQAGEAPGVVIESVECPNQVLVDFPWVTTRLAADAKVELNLVSADPSIGWTARRREVPPSSSSPLSPFDADAVAVAAAALEATVNATSAAIEQRLDGMAARLDRVGYKLAAVSRGTQRSRSRPPPVVSMFAADFDRDSEGAPSPSSSSSSSSSSSALREGYAAAAAAAEARESSLRSALRTSRRDAAACERYLHGKLSGLGQYLQDFLEYTDERCELYRDAAAEAAEPPPRKDSCTSPKSPVLSTSPRRSMSPARTPMGPARTSMSPARTSPARTSTSPARTSMTPQQQRCRWRSASQRSLNKPVAPQLRRELRSASPPPAEQPQQPQPQPQQHPPLSPSSPIHCGPRSPQSHSQALCDLTDLECDLALEQSRIASLTRLTYLDKREGMPSRRSVELYEEYHRLLGVGPSRLSLVQQESCPEFRPSWGKPACANCGKHPKKCPAASRSRARRSMGFSG